MWILRELRRNEEATLALGCDILAGLLAVAAISAIKAFAPAPAVV